MKWRTSLILAIVALALPALAATELDQRVAASRQVIKAFAGNLKEHLIAGIKEGGPLNAIGMCQLVAPDIAASQSLASGWRVGRTSLKTRNPANAPDEWERMVLEDFESRKAAGEAAKTLDYAAFELLDGQRVFRYMKAIPTAEVCLNCHGRSLAAPVAARLDELYPHDTARGFSTGDIRGAFTIVQPLE